MFNVILVGDLNARLDKGNRGADLIEAFEPQSLVCLNNIEVPTYVCHNGSSVIDLLFVSFSASTDMSLGVLSSPITKHCQLVFTFKMKTSLNKRYGKPIKRCDIQLLQSRLASIPRFNSSNNTRCRCRTLLSIIPQ